MAMNSTAQAEVNLRTRIVSGLAWKGASQLILQTVRLGLAIALAHLLTPHDYGLAGMVLVFSTFVIPFADLGLGAALVQRKALSSVDISTVFWTSVGAGATFTIVGIALSGLVAHFYHEPAVRSLFAVLSASFFITALSATHRSLLVREINFRSLEIRLLISTALAVPLAILTAALGYGPWAFIVLELTMATGSTILLWLLVPWRPSLAFSTASPPARGVRGEYSRSSVLPRCQSNSRQASHRPVSGCGSARRLHPLLQRRPESLHANRRTPARDLLSGVRADARRGSANEIGVASSQPGCRSNRDPGERGSGDRRA